MPTANENLYKCIAKIEYTDSITKRQSVGSGIIISPGGLVLTNNHVVEDQDFGTAFGDISIYISEKLNAQPSRKYEAEILIRNEDIDLAILKIKDYDIGLFVPLPHKVSPTLLETPLKVLGYPTVGGNSLTITKGIISGFDDVGNLKTDAEINLGNSGGGAFDENNNFLGVPSFIITEQAGKLGFIIGVDRIQDWFKSILKLRPSFDEAIVYDDFFTEANLNFENNLDIMNRYPQIVFKFAAIEGLFKEGRPEYAFPLIDFIFQKRPRSALAYHYLAAAYMFLGKYPEAATNYKISISYDPYNTGALGNYAVVLSHLRKYEEALSIYEQIIAIDDNKQFTANAYHNMGRIYHLLNELDLARHYYREALKIDPSHSLAIKNLDKLESGV